MGKTTGRRYAQPSHRRSGGTASGRRATASRTTAGRSAAPKKSKHRWLGFFFGLMTCLGVMVLGVFCVYSYYYGMLNFSNGIFINHGAAETDPDLISHGATVSGEMGDLINQMNSDLAKYDILSSSDVTNILLIGVDDRDGNMNDRSDSMILVSINNKTDKIFMTSFMRDTWVNIPGYGYNRLNAATAYGGPSLLMDTLEHNFKIQVDKYVMVNFLSFVDIVNQVGGVEIAVTDEEVPYINEYIRTYRAEVDNTVISVPGGVDSIQSAGTYNLNGTQALAYCRIRYVGADFERTNRQRKVIAAIFNKTRGNIAGIPGLVETLFPKVTTNITSLEMLGMCANAGAYLSYDLYSQRVPADGTWYNYTTEGGAMVLGVDLDSNINMLRQTVYQQ